MDRKEYLDWLDKESDRIDAEIAANLKQPTGFEFVTILIREIKDEILEHSPEVAVTNIMELMDDWVRENDLHPEQVKRMTPEEAATYFKRTGEL